MVCKGREWLIETHDVKSTKDQEKVKFGNSNLLARTVSSGTGQCLRTLLSYHIADTQKLYIWCLLFTICGC